MWENRMKSIIRKLKNLINEQAFDRKKAIFEITNLCIPYTTHIIKLALFGMNTEYQNDWVKCKDEIYNFINQASLYYNLKDSKNLKPRDYLDNFFFGLLENEYETQRTCEKIIKDLKRSGFKIPSKIDYQKLYQGHVLFVDAVIKLFPDDFEITDIRTLLNEYVVGCAV